LYLLQLQRPAAEPETRKSAACASLALHRRVADGLVLVVVMGLHDGGKASLDIVERGTRIRLAVGSYATRKGGAGAERGVQRWHEVWVRDGLVALALPSSAACVALANCRAVVDNIAEGFVDYAGQLRCASE
jgi:hypothetical protein